MSLKTNPKTSKTNGPKRNEFKIEFIIYIDRLKAKAIDNQYDFYYLIFILVNFYISILILNFFRILFQYLNNFKTCLRIKLSHFDSSIYTYIFVLKLIETFQG